MHHNKRGSGGGATEVGCYKDSWCHLSVGPWHRGELEDGHIAGVTRLLLVGGNQSPRRSSLVTMMRAALRLFSTMVFPIGGDDREVLIGRGRDRLATGVVCLQMVM